MPSYVRIIRRGTRNVRLLLEDGCTCRIPLEELPQWTQSVPNTGNTVNTHNEDSRSDTTGTYSYGIYADIVSEINQSNRVILLEDLTFGVELEFVANQSYYRGFCNKMRATVGSERFIDPMRYNASSTTQWSLQTDSSVHNTKRVPANVSLLGYELTSPILHFTESCRNELENVLSAITTDFSGSVNKTCGTHIHIGNFGEIQRTDASVSRIKNFQRNYGYHEAAVFDRLVSSSRRENKNRYCVSCNTDSIDTRYAKMNIMNIFGFGTLENRQHQGTLDIQKIWSWLELNGRYVCAFFNDPDRFTFDPNNPPTLQTFFDMIDLSEGTREFFISRARSLG